MKMTTKNDTTYEDLYICLHNATQKRKDLLFGIKNSLVLQSEYEKILELRKEKTAHLNNVKKSFLKLNRKYQDLKKLLPNVKNIITYTEKELIELEDQIKLLKLDKVKVETDIDVDEEVKENLVETKAGLREELAKSKAKKSGVVVTDEDEVLNKKTNRLNRIKNNLSVIESKLNNL